MSTAHIKAEKGDFAETVLMPGDPLRAKFIAENYLTDAKLVNSVRGMYGYTGLFEGKKVSVMASGMGIPSMGIYSYELFNYFDVNNIIRVGSCGAINAELKLMDVVVALGACTDSNYAVQYGLNGTFAPIASYEIIKKMEHSAMEIGVDIKVGNVLSADVFYDDSETILKWRKMNVLAVEMESAGLFMNAARAGKNAGAIFTVSDIIGSSKKCTTKEREQSFTAMIQVALKAAIK